MLCLLAVRFYSYQQSIFPKMDTISSSLYSIQKYKQFVWLICNHVMQWRFVLRATLPSHQRIYLENVKITSKFEICRIIAENVMIGQGKWVRCTINRSHSTPCKKAEFEHLQIFPGHCLDFFLPVSGKICHSPIKKGKRQPTLIISFSQHSPFFEEQSKILAEIRPASYVTWGVRRGVWDKIVHTKMHFSASA